MQAFRKDRPLAIIGAGVMGTKVAWACARAGLETRLYDIDGEKVHESIARALSWSEGEEQTCVKRHLRAYPDLVQTLDGVQLAFENVFEDLGLKQKVLAEVAAELEEDAYLGSNASSLTVTPLATASGRPERFFNMNFTDPRTSQLVELMVCTQTDAATIKFAQDWAAAIGMIPITTRKEQMGYSFNRLWRVIKKEVLRQVAEGVILPEEIDKAWMLTFGTQYGPCGLMDEIGLHSVAKVEKCYEEDSGDPSDAPPDFLLEMVARGETGISSGKGFYKYPDPLFRRKGFLKATT